MIFRIIGDSAPLQRLAVTPKSWILIRNILVISWSETFSGCARLLGILVQGRVLDPLVDSVSTPKTGGSFT